MMWKIYTWFYVVVMIIGWVAIFTSVININMSLKIFDSIISSFGIVPLFLFTYNKRWLKKIFWQVFFFIFVLFEIKDIPLFLKTNPHLLLHALIGIGLSFPAYIAIFLYAFHPEKT